MSIRATAKEIADFERLALERGGTVNGGDRPSQELVAKVWEASLVTEKQFQKHVTDYADAHGWKWHHPFYSQKSSEGWVDLVLVRDRIIFAELKTEYGKPTKAQLAWMRALERAGAAVFLWRPSQWDMIREVLA